MFGMSQARKRVPYDHLASSALGSVPGIAGMVDLDDDEKRRRAMMAQAAAATSNGPAPARPGKPLLGKPRAQAPVPAPANAQAPTFDPNATYKTDRFQLGRIAAALGGLANGNGVAAIQNFDAQDRDRWQQQQRQRALSVAMGGGAPMGGPAAAPGGAMQGPMSQGPAPQGGMGGAMGGGMGGGMIDPQRLQAMAYLNPQAAMDYQFTNAQAMAQQQRLNARADEFGLQGRERLAYLANPEQYGDSMATNYEASNLAPGATRVYGDGRPAFHNADTVGLQRNAVDAQGNQLDYDLGVREDATERYGHDVTATGDRLGYDANMARLSHDRSVAAREAAGGGKRSLSPIYGTGADGTPMVAQLTTSGELIPATVPDGFSPLSPFDKAQQRATGSAMGKGAAERELGLPRQARQLEAFKSDVDSLRERVNLAKGQTSKANAGPLAQYNPMATDLNATLETIRANAGFDKLQEMRDNSPTGGAVGQVSNIELRGLQSAWGNISRAQSPEQLDRNLDAFMTRYEGMLGRMEQAYREDMAAGLFGPGDAMGANMANGTTPALPPGFVLE